MNRFYHLCSLATVFLLLLSGSISSGESPTPLTKNDDGVFQVIGGFGVPLETERFCFHLPEKQREELPVAAIVSTGGLIDAPVVMVYRDGTILWLASYQTLTIGEVRPGHQYKAGPYFRGQIDTNLVEDFLASLDAFGSFEYAGEGEKTVPAGHPLVHTVIFYPSTHRVISLHGYNEIIEKQEDVFIAHDDTRLSLKSMRRDEALDSQPADYKRYRIIRRSCLEWLLSLPELVIEEPEELGQLRSHYSCFKPANSFEGTEPVILDATTGQEPDS